MAKKHTILVCDDQETIRAVAKAESRYNRGERVALWLIAVSVGAYFAGLWFIRDRFHQTGAPSVILLVAGVACLATPLSPWPVPTVASIVAVAAVLRTWHTKTSAATA